MAQSSHHPVLSITHDLNHLVVFRSLQTIAPTQTSCRSDALTSAYNAVDGSHHRNRDVPRFRLLSAISESPFMAQSVCSARGICRSANRRIADCRPRASGYRSMADLIQSASECTFMTRLGHSADSGLLPRRPLPLLADGLYTTRMPTLLWRSRFSADCGKVPWP